MSYGSTPSLSLDTQCAIARSFIQSMNIPVLGDSAASCCWNSTVTQPTGSLPFDDRLAQLQQPGGYIGCGISANDNSSYIWGIRIIADSRCQSNGFSNLAGLQNLSYLEVRNCNMNGVSIPWTSLGINNPMLRNLNLENNSLVGYVGDDIGRLTHLESLILKRNNLIGTLPWIMGYLTRLTRLDIALNQLTGNLPDNIAYLPLAQLDASGNNFYGPLPNMTSMTFLQNCNLPNERVCVALGMKLPQVCNASNVLPCPYDPSNPASGNGYSENPLGDSSNQGLNPGFSTKQAIFGGIGGGLGLLFLSCLVIFLLHKRENGTWYSSFQKEKEWVSRTKDALVAVVLPRTAFKRMPEEQSEPVSGESQDDIVSATAFMIEDTAPVPSSLTNPFDDVFSNHFASNTVDMDDTAPLRENAV